MWTKSKIEKRYPGVKVYLTDNANARAIGKREKWTFQYGATFGRFDTLQEIHEFLVNKRTFTYEGVSINARSLGTVTTVSKEDATAYFRKQFGLVLSHVNQLFPGYQLLAQ